MKINKKKSTSQSSIAHLKSVIEENSNSSNMSPLEYAKKMGDDTLLKVIQDCYFSPAIKIFDYIDQNDLVNLKKIVESDNSLIETTDTEGYTPLMHACSNNSVSVLEYLVNKGANLNKQDIYGLTALMYGIFSSSTEVINLLVNCNIDFYVEDRDYNTALYYSIIENNTSYVKTLLSHNVDINFRNKEGLTALMIAVAQNNLEVVSLLIENGANCDITDNNGYNALIYAISNKNLDIIKIVASNTSYDETMTENDIAYNLDNIEEIPHQEEKLTVTDDYDNQSSKDTELKDTKEFPENHQFQSLDDYKNLLYKNNEEEKLTSDDFEVLDRSSIHVVNDLKSDSAENKITNEKNTPHKIFTLIENDNEEDAIKALRTMSKIDITNNNGHSVLISSCIKKMYKLTEEILAYGVNLEYKNNITSDENEVGCNALMYSVCNKDLKMVRLLLDYGANPNNGTSKGWNPLMFSIGTSDIKLIKLLVEYDASVDIKGEHGFSPLDIALRLGDQEILDLLS